jgi:DNA-binding winged helix-turn-helix (wHTH) protein
MGPNLSWTLEPEPEAVAEAHPVLPMRSRYIRFGPFQVDQQRQEVTKDGSRLKLQGKVYQVLLALIEKQGEVVTREELRARLWPPDTQVNYDANVNTTVNKLRQALGDSTEQPLYIETVPRRGYCLVMQPQFSDRPLIAAVPTHGSDSNGEAPESKITPIPRKPEFWTTVSVVALILVGMLLGAGITRLWLAHFALRPGGHGF